MFSGQHFKKERKGGPGVFSRIHQRVMSVSWANVNIEQLLPHVAVSEWLEMRPITHNELFCALLQYYASRMLGCPEMPGLWCSSRIVCNEPDSVGLMVVIARDGKSTVRRARALEVFGRAS